MVVDVRKSAIATGLLIGALLAADSSWAWSGGKRGGARFSASGGSPRASFATGRVAPSSGFPQRFHHHGRAVFFVGAPFLYYSWPYGYYYAPPPYYYGPDYAAQREMPEVYVEKFEGTPTPETKGEIYCPSLSAHYPDVKDCPGGWQRVIREGERSADSG